MDLTCRSLATPSRKALVLIGPQSPFLGNCGEVLQKLPELLMHCCAIHPEDTAIKSPMRTNTVNLDLFQLSAKDIIYFFLICYRWSIADLHHNIFQSCSAHQFQLTLIPSQLIHHPSLSRVPFIAATASYSG